LTPLIYCAVGFSLLFFAMHMKGMRNEILRRRVKARQILEVERAARGLGANA
jgi:heme exporter protein C